MTLPPTTDLRSPTSSSEAEVLVKVEGVSKKFCRDLKKSLWYGVKDVASELLPFGKQKSEIRDRRSDPSSLTSDLRHPTSEPSLRDGEFWANKDISFELRRGECLGLIGRNGAGKTTLLKMLNGLIKPDAGTIEMRGRVGALIALGAGFNPILTGRENVYVNGSILGLSKKEIDEKIESIIEFAEIREFIDSPVQSYSSGMQVRLGFSVATAMEPDVLILDEVLAVGDFSFRQKCLRRVADMINSCAVIFVSHNFDQIERICTRGLVMNRGVCVGSGPVFEMRQIYDTLIDQGTTSTWTVKGVTVIGPDKNERLTPVGNGFKARLILKLDEAIPDLICRLRFQNSIGEYVAGYHSLNHRPPFSLSPGEQCVEFDFPAPPLKRGRYYVDFFINGATNDLLKVSEIKRFAEIDVKDRAHGFDFVQL